MGNFIKIDRKLLESDIFTRPRKAQQFRVWMYLLMNAAYEIKDNDKIKRYGVDHLEPGQLIRTKNTISHDLGLTENQVRTALRYLEKSGMITSSRTGKVMLITIVNWGVYQSSKNVPEQDSDKKQNRKKSRPETAKSPVSEPQTKKYKEVYPTDIKEEKEKTAAAEEEDVGPDGFGEIPEGWTEENEADFKMMYEDNDWKTRKKWAAYWKE